MNEDKGIKWIREVRSKISQELHHDPVEFVKFHRSLRKKQEDESIKKMESKKDHSHSQSQT